MKIIVAPWSSKHEFVKVYDDMHSDDIRLWKQARDTILMWQARVDKLPTSIDVTLPLLDAKIALEDHTVPYSAKAIFMATAVQRFVTSVLRIPQTKHSTHQTMASLASDIGLPAYFIELRNEIVHGHGAWGGGDTIKCAVDSCFSWIMSFYWNRALLNIRTADVTAPPLDEEDWPTFMTCLNRFGELLMLELKKSTTSGIYNEAADALLRIMEIVYAVRPEETTEEIVSHLLLYDNLPGSENLKYKKKKCGCVIEPNIIDGVNPALNWIASLEETVEPIITCLIKKGKEDSPLAVEWIYLIVNSLLHPACVWSPNSFCRTHLLVFDKGVQVDWKKVMVELIQAETEWAADITTQLMDATEMALTNGQKEKLKSLLKIFKSSSDEGNEKCESISEVKIIHTVDDVIEEAQRKSSAFGESLEDLRKSLYITERGSIGDTPLGILPHQKDNPRLFHELILPYPPLNSTIN
ncbi:hypothetical protein Pcinc_014990 [Petrolisthes cinctipes]|uniref:Las1-like family protein n=1 Tax=Petrolisthes cinctipes TaxID=88211 RepID=A0AAE1FVG4_PETCI|nr:hypothetical protein Pcinc_014990 [Petrolisthes cinctipes]